MLSRGEWDHVLGLAINFFRAMDTKDLTPCVTVSPTKHFQNVASLSCCDDWKMDAEDMVVWLPFAKATWFRGPWNPKKISQHLIDLWS